MITVDGNSYNVFTKLESIKRSFDFVSGPNEGVSIVGSDILDTLGTAYSYELQFEPDVTHESDYHALYEVLSSPNRVHTFTLPYGTSTITFQGKVEGGTDVLNGRHDIWRHLTVKISPIAPQRTPT